MEENIIFGIVYTILDEEVGPNPYVSIPKELPDDIKMLTSIKAITVLTGDKGITTSSLIYLPFPTLKLKGIIKFIESKDNKRRGGILQSALTLLFSEEHDLTFYKYVNDLETIFNKTAKNLKVLEELHAEKTTFEQEIELFRTDLLGLLDELRTNEYSLGDFKAFPDIVKGKETINYQFKVILIGEMGVGKTSLVLRFCSGAFKRTYISTIGVNVSDKLVKVKDNKIVQLVIWDIAGQIKFQTMRTEFYKGAKGIFFVFDLTDPNSFNNIKSWYQDIKNNLSSSEKNAKKRELFGFLIGNKRDLKEERKVKAEDALKLSKELNLEYLETSALSGDNVQATFYKMAENLYLKNK